MDDPFDANRAPRRQYLRRALRLRCPLCGARGLFRGLTMHDSCPICGFAFEREPGYWTSAATLNFMISGGVVLMIVGPIVFTGISVPLILAISLVLAAVLPLLWFRHFKAIWLAIDLHVNPPTPAEQIAGYLRVTRQAKE
jgi:uncharacterized protein (DUF983 family)